MSYFPTIFSHTLVDLANEEEVSVADVVNQRALKVKGATSNSATSGDVTVPLTEVYSGYTTNSTAAIAASLADGESEQIKIIKLESFDTNNMVLTPDSFADGTTITFDADSEVAILLFVGSSWQLIYTDATVA